MKRKRDIKCLLKIWVVRYTVLLRPIVHRVWHMTLWRFTSQYAGCFKNKKNEKEVKKGGKMRNSLVGLENGYPSAYEVGTYYEVLFFFLWLIEKISLCANAHDFSESGPQGPDFRWSDQKFQFLSWNLIFRSQFSATALLIMYIIVQNIFRFFPQLIDPQSEGKYELGWGNHAEQSCGCIATSYLLLSDIAEL